MDLHDRVALITGASGGLGAVIARLLAEHGVHVAVTHLATATKLWRCAAKVGGTGRRAFVVHLDQTDPASCTAAVEDTVKALGRLDILINNARYGRPAGR